MTGPGRLWVVPDEARIEVAPVGTDPLARSSWRALRDRVLSVDIEPWRLDFEPWHRDYRNPRLDRIVNNAVRSFAAQDAARREALLRRELLGDFRTYPTVSTVPVIPFDRKAPTMGYCSDRFCAVCSPFNRVYMAPVVPEFDKRLVNGAKVRVKHKSRDEVYEFTANVIIRNGGRIIGVRASASAPRFNAADGYTLEILSAPLPTTAGLYTSKSAPSLVVYRLNSRGGWLRWDTTRDVMETCTAFTVGREVGAEGLVPLKADRAA